MSADRVDADPTFRLRDQVFEIPTLVWGIDRSDPGQRLVAGLATTAAATRHGDIVLVDAFEPAAVDLGLVRAGRCPLLVEHLRRVDYLVGAVVDAWIEDQALHFIARFARGGEADRLWGLLTDGFPLSVSVGAKILAAEPLGADADGDDRRYRATRWALSEISVCVHGRDEAAEVRCLDRSAEARARLAAKARAAAADARLKVRHALHLDRWEKWSTGAGVTIAERLGVDRDRLCDALDAEVRRHCERLQAELAG
jgi:hypothetical protein